MRGAPVIEDPELPSLLLAKGTIDRRSIRFLATVLAISLIGLQPGTATADVTEVNVELTSATLIDPAHLQVEGTVTCDAPALFVDIFLELRQRGGIFGFRSGFDSTFLNTCDVTPTALSILVTGGPFHPGAALFDAFAFACDETQCADDRSFGTVRIRR
jgi:hypothetical protein